MTETQGRRGPWPLGELLKRKREEAKLSLRAASDAAGFSAATWQHIEKGERTVAKGIVVEYTPTPDNVVSAAQVVGLDAAELLRLGGLDPGLAPERPGGPTISQREVASVFQQLSEPSRKAHLYLMRKTLLAEQAERAGVDAEEILEADEFEGRSIEMVRSQEATS
ncbi:helix-turn-helix transcriptional regulator [Amycolatopsis thailandensis]|uniref:helix-turn-helix domain-containing protein n=1 Tax=Amycolatopsis thailandensis TaxID=589330 RepID=UPI00365C01FE